jgi:hypothetical protein
MSPTEQIKKCMHDLSIEDLTERSFFEKKFIEYKALLENEGKLTPLSIKTTLTVVTYVQNE